MKNFTFLILLVCFININAQNARILLRPSTAEMAGFDSKALSRVDSFLSLYVNNKWIGGATALIAKDGKIAWFKGIGLKDVEGNTAMTKDEIFRIASQTKAITSVAVMMLFEEGKFLLDDPIYKFIPEFKHPVVLKTYNKTDTSFTTVPATKEITIRQLLMHASGIHYGQIGNDTFNAIYSKNHMPSLIGSGNLVISEQIKKLAKLPLAHEPGARFTYGLSTDVLGYLVEIISGLTLDKFFKTRIFDPLGMKDTYFYLPKNKQSRLARLNGEDKNGLVIKNGPTFYRNGDWITDYPDTEGTLLSGGGGLSSTAYDYALFMQMLLNGGTYNGHRLLSPVSVKMMTMNQAAVAGVTNKNFGLGFNIYGDFEEAKLGVTKGSFEWGGMFSSSYWVDPSRHIIGQLFINQIPMTHYEIHDRFKALVYAGLK
jgi:CubicO group peptidase (beta-lactamase class C family)